MHDLLRRTALLATKTVLLAALAALAGACQAGTQTETETHFLEACTGECPGGLSCVCGACTRPCTANDACVELSSTATCDSTPPTCWASVTSMCDVECTTNDACKRLGSSHTCIAGRCRSPGVSGPDGGGVMTTGGAASGGTGGLNGGSSGDGGSGGVANGGAGGSNTGGSGGSTQCDPMVYCCDQADGTACGTDRVCIDGQCVNSECTPQAGTGCSPATGGGRPCCSGLQCCQGVPYDAAGACHAECNLDSDREKKTDIVAADPDALLESVARLPISTWRYRSDLAATHVGPMAQDFAAELGFGSDDRVIAAVDASGVALAAIQALHQRVEHLSGENAALRRRLEKLENRADSAKAARAGPEPGLR